MGRLTLWSAAAVALFAALSFTLGQERNFGTGYQEEETLIAASYLLGISEGEREHKRFLSLKSMSGLPKERQAEFKKVLVWWIHQMSSGMNFVRPEEVPKSNGELWVIDLRDYRWNAEGWRAVALREPFFREPRVSSSAANALRTMIGEKQPKDQDGTYHVIGVVSAAWLFRETIESNRSASYYDLLFAERRFGKGTGGTPGVPGIPDTWRTEKKIIQHNGGDYTYPDDSGRVNKNVAAGRYEVELKFKVKGKPAQEAKEGKASFVDFPKDEDDWNEFFGVKAVSDFLKKQNIDVRHGAVVAGSDDDPAKGSLVSRNNRVVAFLSVPTGVAMQTFDTDTTSGEFDYIEKVPEVAVGKIKFKAGELLASLPTGGQAGLLIDGNRKRIERADLQFAHNKIDPRFQDVRTMMGCVGCHATDGGVIAPRDMFKDLLKDGIDLKIKDRDLRNRVQAFFLEWEDLMEGWRKPYLKLIIKATSDPLKPGDKSLTPAALVKAFNGMRDWYDGPVGPTQAALEVGAPEAAYKLVLTKSPRARLGQLAQGKLVPRATFDKDLYRESILLWEGGRK